MKDLYNKWLVYAPTGLVFIGAGLSFAIDAGTLRFSGAPFFEWFLYGTFSLVVFNAGVSIFGQAVIFRVRYLQKKDAEQDKPI